MLALSETWGGALAGHGTCGTLDDQASIFWGKSTIFRLSHIFGLSHMSICLAMFGISQFFSRLE